MKRIGNLWEEIISYDNLFAAAKAAAAGKRNRADVARFGLDLENEVVRLRNELDRDAYQPGPYRCFEVREPKRRLISASPFRDRVVHHALTRVIEPVFERRFTSNSYACRKGRGTHRALTAALPTPSDFRLRQTSIRPGLVVAARRSPARARNCAKLMRVSAS